MLGTVSLFDARSTLSSSTEVTRGVVFALEICVFFEAVRSVVEIFSFFTADEVVSADFVRDGYVTEPKKVKKIDNNRNDEARDAFWAVLFFFHIAFLIHDFYVFKPWLAYIYGHLKPDQ